MDHTEYIFPMHYLNCVYDNDFNYFYILSNRKKRKAIITIAFLYTAGRQEKLTTIFCL